MYLGHLGAGGDLTKRLLVTALNDLQGAGLLDKGTTILGVDIADRDGARWPADLSAAMQSFTHDSNAAFHTDKLDAKTWEAVARRLF